MNDRLTQQTAFLSEIEKLKTIYRRNRTIDRARFENSAEHSWHLALMAIVLCEHADQPGLDLFKVVKMLLIHDLAEIHAGDTWLYDTEAVASQQQREDAGAETLFGLLPSEQGDKLNSLRREFDARITPEARFAVAIDALQPLANHVLTGRPDDEDPKPHATEVLARKRHIEESSVVLWELAQRLISQSAADGLYE
jgi:putative hydrolases of HD superfamily